MSKDLDLKEAVIVVFGLDPLEFASLRHVKSADIDIRPDQFLDHLRNRVREWKLDVGDPFVQVLSPTVFKAGKKYLLRACGLTLNEIKPLYLTQLISYLGSCIAWRRRTTRSSMRLLRLSEDRLLMTYITK